jgi:hypothetical protein
MWYAAVTQAEHNTADGRFSPGWEDGERAGNRTQDFLLKRQVLYRLSYTLDHANVRQTGRQVNVQPG